MRKRSQKKTPADAADVAGIFETAEGQRGFPPPPDLKRGFKEVVGKIFDDEFDLVEEFETIEASLSITQALTPQVISRAANQTEDMARRAYRLYLVGKVEHAAYLRKTEGLIAAIRDSAEGLLEKEKSKGIRTKAITEADVTGYCATKYPEAWEDVMARRDRAKAMLGYLEQLADLAKKRCFTVARMLSPNGEL